MPKYVPTPLSSTLSNSAASQINENLERISAQLEDTVSRSGEIPNQMEADLDLNSNDILNVNTIDAETIETDNLVYRGAPLEIIEFVDVSRFATAAQGLLADSAVQPGDPVGLLSDSDSFKVFTAAERTKLSGLSTTFESRAVASSTTIPAPATSITLLINEMILTYRRDASGTALTTGGGDKWSPADVVVTPQHFGATASGGGDDTSAINLAITYLQTKTRRTLYFPRGTYLITAGMTPVTGSNWAFIGEGWGVSRIKQTADAPILQIDTSAADSYFGVVEGLALEGSNVGADVNSAAIKIIASLSSATGIQYWRFANNIMTACRYGFWAQDTLKRTWAGSDTLSAHRYFNFVGNNITPTGPVEIGLYFEGAGPADGSQIIGNTFRGTVAAVSVGNGSANFSTGDTLWQGNHFNGIATTSTLCLRLRGPSNANYNQLNNFIGNQFETSHSTTCAEITNQQNFNFISNSFDPDKPPTFTSCTRYIWTGDGSLTINSTKSSSIEAPLTIVDPAGVRHGNPIISRRSVDNSYARFLGGSSTATGAKLDLFGSTHATLPNFANLDVSRFQIRKTDTTGVLLDVNPATGAVGFFGAAGTTKPTVTGSRGGNAALASLLTALANLGLLTDSSTA